MCGFVGVCLVRTAVSKGGSCLCAKVDLNSPLLSALTFNSVLLRSVSWTLGLLDSWTLGLLDSSRPPRFAGVPRTSFPPNLTPFHLLNMPGLLPAITTSLPKSQRDCCVKTPWDYRGRHVPQSLLPPLGRQHCGPVCRRLQLALANPAKALGRWTCHGCWVPRNRHSGVHSRGAV
jgi:hypothetical protein